MLIAAFNKCGNGCNIDFEERYCREYKILRGENVPRNQN
jgi:hypothetical protein